MPRYAKLIYNGYWWAPERADAAGGHRSDVRFGGQRRGAGCPLYKGNVSVVGRQSATDSLFDANIATFDDDGGAYNQADAEGFIKLNALRLRIAANRGRDLK